MERTLVLAAEADPSRIPRAINALGWIPEAHLPDPANTPGDDRVLGAWARAQRADGELELVDDGYVRALHLRGLQAAPLGDDLARALPCRDHDAVLAELGSLDPARLVAGIRAAALLRDPGLVIGLAPLRHHPDPAVVAEAGTAMTALLPTLVADGEAQLAAMARDHGGANPAWGAIAAVEDRRQALRWLLHDVRTASPGLVSTLRAALADGDWEVRVGAMIAAVRWRLTALGGVVERLELPHVTRGGPLADDRALLRALRRAATAELAGLRDPEGETGERALRWRHLRDCIAGREPRRRDQVWLFVHALSEPVDDRDSAAPAWPGPALNGGGGAQLGALPLGWVPPLPHWLGGDDQQPPNPLRETTGPGCYVATRPLRCREAGHAGGDEPWHCTVAEARAWCAQASGAGLRLAIPIADTWECALRGPDGRRFPWGNGLESDHLQATSPWGHGGYGVDVEWADGSGVDILRGGRGAVPCAAWHPPSDGQRALLRPMVVLEGGPAV